MKRFQLILIIFITLNLNAFDTQSLLKQGKDMLNNTSYGDYKSLINSAVLKAVNELKNGFINNSLAKIELPPTLKVAANLGKNVGADKWANELQKSINEAATKAVAGAADVFNKSIKNMNSDDIKSLFNGSDSSISEFLEKSSGNELKKVFTPIIEDMMNKNSFATAYNKLNSLVKNSSSIKEVKSMASNFGMDKYLPNDNDDLNGYISQKTLEGLFAVMRQKESSLRSSTLGNSKKILENILK